jgi:hypothetical protein
VRKAARGSPIYHRQRGVREPDVAIESNAGYVNRAAAGGDRI